MWHKLEACDQKNTQATGFYHFLLLGHVVGWQSHRFSVLQG